MLVTVQPVRRTTLRITPHWRVALDWPYLVGMGLFYLNMVMPARLQEQMSVFSLDAPPMAQQYGVGYPYLTALEVVIFGYAAFMWRRRGAGLVIANWPFAAYLVAAVVSVAVLWMRYLLGDETRMWGDGALALVRVTAMYALFVALPIDSSLRGRTLQNALGLLFVSSLLLNLAGFSNPATYSNEAGRMSVAGLDFSTASYFGFALALCSLTLRPGRRQAVLFLTGILGAVMGGGRNALLLFLISLGCMMLLRSRRAVKSVFLMICCVIGASALALVAFPQAWNNLPILQRQRDNAIYYAGGVEPTESTLTFFPFLRSLPRLDPAMTGRFNTWSTALELLVRQGGVPLASDWYVQQELVPLGVPSHAHNGYLQTLLKFSVLAVPMWLAAFASAWRGVRARSPYGLVLVFLLASLVVDYWLMIIKAAFLLFAFVGLNEAWLAEHVKKSNAPRLTSVQAEAPA